MTLLLDFICIFEALTKHYFDMKRQTLFFLTVLLLVLYSCGEQTPQAVQDMEKNLKDIETKIQETNVCDELQLLTFSVLGLRTDLEKLQQDETVKEADIVRLTDAIDKLDASLTGKYAALDCNQAAGEEEIDTFGDDEYEDYNVL